jgi:hypothetical protein
MLELDDVVSTLPSSHLPLFLVDLSGANPGPPTGHVGVVNHEPKRGATVRTYGIDLARWPDFRDRLGLRLDAANRGPVATNPVASHEGFLVDGQSGFVADARVRPFTNLECSVWMPRWRHQDPSVVFAQGHPFSPVRVIPSMK